MSIEREDPTEYPWRPEDRGDPIARTRRDLIRRGIISDEHPYGRPLTEAEKRERFGPKG